MIARARGLSIALLVMLGAAPCLAQAPASPPPAPSPTHPPSPPSSPRISGRGGVGGLIGGSKFYAADEYSQGALARFDFSGQFRYFFTPHLRFQASPGFTWSAYSKKEPPPFTDSAFPADATKEHYLALLVPITAQLQMVWGKSAWLYHLGAGPGIYRLWIENHRKVLVDPVTLRLHRGPYLGVAAEVGVERFLKALPNTSLEVSAIHHYVLAKRDEQFPTGWNSAVGVLGLRVGTNYYFDVNRPKKRPDLPLP